MNCINCGIEFESKSSTAKYCSSKCAKASQRLSETKHECPAKDVVLKRPANFGLENCTCQHCRGVKLNKLSITLNHGPYKTCAELAAGERNRVALPGDVDYVGRVA